MPRGGLEPVVALLRLTKVCWHTQPAAAVPFLLWHREPLREAAKKADRPVLPHSAQEHSQRSNKPCKRRTARSAAAGG